MSTSLLSRNSNYTIVNLPMQIQFRSFSLSQQPQQLSRLSQITKPSPPATLTHKTNGPVEIKLVLVEKVMLEVWKTFAVERKRCWKLRNFKFRSVSLEYSIKTETISLIVFYWKLFPRKEKLFTKYCETFFLFDFISQMYFSSFFFINFFRAVFFSSRRKANLEASGGDRRRKIGLLTT